jgi:hypothetical protein
LQLEQQHAPVSKPELRRLAKRAVISLPHLETKNCSSKATIVQNELCQDLGNMLHMMNQVQDFVASYAALHGDKYPFLNESKATDDDDDATTMAAILYDVPRGVTSAPLFRVDSNKEESSTAQTTDRISNVDVDKDTISSTDAPTDDSSMAQLNDKHDATLSHTVRDSYWSHHLHRVGGHEYFQVVVDVVDTNDKK